MAEGGKEQGGNPAGPNNGDGAGPDAWQREQHEAHLRTIDTLTNQFAANQEKQDSNERKKSFRECITIWLVTLTLVATGFADVIFYKTMQDARGAAVNADVDSAAALRAANTNSATALFHADTATSKALKAAKDANRISSDAAHAGQRAFVFVQEVKQTPLPNGVLLNPMWKNSGTTPTRELVVFTAAETTDGPLPEHFGYHYELKGRESFIGPDSIIIGGEMFIPEGLKRLIAQGTKRVYIWQTAKYQDVFSVSHITQFCQFTKAAASGANGKPFIGMGIPEDVPVQLKMVYCPRHNCDDQECAAQSGSE